MDLPRHSDRDVILLYVVVCDCLYLRHHRFDYYRNQVKTKNTEIDFTIGVVKDVSFENSPQVELKAGGIFTPTRNFTPLNNS